MTSAAEASKKRNSFSILTWKDPSSSSKLDTDESELENSRFIPESKRGWKYDLPHHPAASSSSTDPSQPTRTTKVGVQRPNTTDSQLEPSRGSNGLDVPSNSHPRVALSAPASPGGRVTTLQSPDFSYSESSSSEDEPEPGSPGAADLPASHEPVPKHAAKSTQHPDDLVYPDSYPWRPSPKNPNANYIHPAHRNPTAKQAFYDTHFGSSSNYRGLLPASGSFLSLNPLLSLNSSSKADTRRQSSDRSGETVDGGEDVQSIGIVSTIKKPFATASKLLTKARRKSMGVSSQVPEVASRTHEEDETERDIPQRPHPVPLYAAGGDDLAAQRSGFSYGLSMEDAVQVEAVVSRQASQEDLSPAVLDEQLFSPPAASPEVTSSRWKETLQSVWGFLPSFPFSESPNQSSSKAIISSTNILEPEAIPSVKKDPGNPDYFKNLSGNVVILGGYRGSVLRDAETNMMMWIPIKVGVGLRRPTLELGLSSEAEDRSEDLVYSSEMCTHIGKLVDMGKRLEERVAGRRHAKVYSWGYDWRLSLARSSRRLTTFLEELYDASADPATGHGKKRGAKVIAHSMGGLVALHALATCSNPRIFEGLVFASTPFRGTPNILGPFRFGDSALFNDTICSPRATFSFRSSFYLLPTDGRCFEVPVLKEMDEEEVEQTQNDRGERFRDVDFLQPGVWDDLGLSPCLEVGRRRQVVALARKGYVEGKDSISARDRDMNDRAAFESESSQVVQTTSSTSADSNLDVASPQGQSSNENANGLSMGLMEGLTDGTDAAILTQADFGPAPEEQEQLQPQNRQGAARNDPRDSTSQTAFDNLDYPTQSWLYLERTLSGVRQFWRDIEIGFDADKLQAGSYPPLMLMVSGRTPSVRGALVGVSTTTADNQDAGDAGWKDDVRAGDYSRMTYGAGDGVITRRSATTLPGQWSKLLVNRTEAESLPQELWGKGAPFKSNPNKPPGKARLKLDKYSMKFDGPGIVESAHRHVTLLSDVDGIGKCLEAVRRANLARGRVPLNRQDV
ncbi:uncharacterized protein UTRI_02808_B [Ustilago trichophora]|uniref:Uncharacterized protein n=1 Tax=Ustilago trichophora TaxID=86804 RepID=A0A5C3E2Z2_9BASI|nr:uncharacterized protein UTRI_02808_B [Ustilago trichophora]